MKRLVIGTVLALCAPFASAMTCEDEAQNRYFIEPYGNSSILINEIPFHEIRVEEFTDINTNIHATWLRDMDGAIALISVITNNHSQTAHTKLYVIEGSTMNVGTCK